MSCLVYVYNLARILGTEFYVLTVSFSILNLELKLSVPKFYDKFLKIENMPPRGHVSIK